MRRILVAVGITLLTASCGGSDPRDTKGAASVLSPATDALKVLEASNRDCLQYPVERRPDGSEVWNADYVYFYLVRVSDGALVRGDDGAPLASGLLASETLRWMEGREPIPGTGWRCKVWRSVQEMASGRLIRETQFTQVEDVDFRELIEKDRAAHGNGGDL